MAFGNPATSGPSPLTSRMQGVVFLHTYGVGSKTCTLTVYGPFFYFDSLQKKKKKLIYVMVKYSF